MGKSILGINAQYLKRTEIKVRTLGMVELDCKHTGLNLNKVVCEVLQCFELNIRNVYSYTTDNGANMVKASEIFSKAQKELFDIDVEHDEEEEGHEDGDEGENSGDEDDDDVTLNFEDIDLENVENELDELVSVSVVARCIAHTLQLVAFDVTKLHKNSIKSIRKFVKNIRKSTHNDLFKQSGLKKPPKDICTRWNSTFLMIKNINDEKSFYQSLSLQNILLLLNQSQLQQKFFKKSS